MSFLPCFYDGTFFQDTLRREGEKWASELSLKKGGGMVRLENSRAYGIRRYLKGSRMIIHTDHAGNSFIM